MRWRVAAWSRSLDRRRHEVLTDGVVFTVVAAVGAALLPGWRPLIYGVLCVGFLGTFVGSLVIANVLNRRRQRTLELGTDEFFTPRLGSGVLMGLSAAPGSALLISVLAIGEGEQHPLLLPLAAVGVLAFCVYALRGAWRGQGVRLTADGVAADLMTGSIFVPWEALHPEEPVRPGDDWYQLRLVVARPELVRRSGWVGADPQVCFEGVDADVVAAAIVHYVAWPWDRSAIGTAEELRRLAAVLPGDLAETADEAMGYGVLEPGATRGGVAALGLIVAAGVVLPAVFHGVHWLELVGNGLVMAGVIGLSRRLRLSAVFRRLRRT